MRRCACATTRPRDHAALRRAQPFGATSTFACLVFPPSSSASSAGSSSNPTVPVISGSACTDPSASDRIAPTKSECVYARLPTTVSSRLCQSPYETYEVVIG